MRDAVFMVRGGIIGNCEFPLEELFPEYLEEPDQQAMLTSWEPGDPFIPLEDFMDEEIMHPLEALMITQGVADVDDLPSHIRRHLEDCALREAMESQSRTAFSDEFRDGNGIYAITLGVPSDAVVNEAWQPYVSPDIQPVISPFTKIPLQPQLENVRISQFSSNAVRFVKWDTYGCRRTRREISRFLRRLGETRPKSHGKWGREPFREFNVRETPRKVAGVM